jgi:hypothetical protein
VLYLACSSRKIALDETRILILGSQILLGFGFRGVFGDAFETLSASARYLDGAALGLLVTVLALLIAPGPCHRIAEGGQDNGDLHRFTTIIADLSLLPFALALGIGLFVATEVIFGIGAAVVTGTIATVSTIALWYGLPQLRRRFVGERERMITHRQRDERVKTPLYVKIEQLLTEARVILPGAKALLGFQLAIVLTQSFERLPAASKVVHAASLFLVALAVVLLMAPASYYRMVYAGEETEDLHRVGSVLITAATLPLGLAGDIYVVIAKISGSETVGILSGIMASSLLLGLWYVYPFFVAARRRDRSIAR